MPAAIIVLMNIEAIQHEANEAARQVGWGDGPERSFAEHLLLMHAEITEVYDEFDSGHGPTQIYEHNGKPEGIPIELADVCIRICDYLLTIGLSLSDFVDRNQETIVGNYNAPLPSLVARWHRYLSQALELWRKGGEPNDPASGIADRLAALWVDIQGWFQYHEMDMEQVIRRKIAFNATRPYRHGGKRI